MALSRVVIDCTKGQKQPPQVIALSSEEEVIHFQRIAVNQEREQQKLDAEQAKKNKKASLLAQPNKSVTVQDLIDLGLL